jgi:uncharacterized protein YkwD
VTYRRILVALTAAAFVVAVAGIQPTRPAAAQSVGCPVNPADLSIDAEEQAALDAINALRAAAGLAPLAWSSSLGQAAANKSASMATTGSFAHDDPGRTWLQRVQECGYRASWQVYENLALGSESARAAVQMWRDSPAHHQNMMQSGLRAAGIARARAGSGTWFWTAVFAAVLDGPPPPAPAPAPPAAEPSAAAALQVGEAATVTVGRGDCLNVRHAAGRSAPPAGCLPDGTVVLIVAGPQSADGTEWWLLGGLGWASGEFLAAGAAPSRTPVTSLAAAVRALPAD